MKPVEKISQATRNDLEVLCNRVKNLAPTVICNTGDSVVSASLQFYASFLKTKQSDTLDLCVLFKQTGAEVTISADLVKGGSGEILSEMLQIALSSQVTEEECDKVVEQIRDYILSQEEEILEDLTA